MRRRRALAATLVAVALFLLAGRWAAALYTDFLWFDALGAAAVWHARLAATAAIELGSFAAAFAFAFLNLYAVRRSVVSLVLPRRIANIEIGEEVSSQYLLYAVIAGSAAIGIAMLLPTGLWHQALLATIGRPFGEADPYLARDLGRFVYWLPFEATLYSWTLLMVGIVTALVVLLYALTPSLGWDRGRLYVSAYVRRHFIMLGGVLLLLLAWSYRLATFQLLAGGNGADGVFTVLDQLVRLPTLLLLAMISLSAALVVLWSGWTGQVRLAFIAVGAVLLLSFTGRVVAPAIVRRGIDPAEAAAQQRAFTNTRLSYTRRAFAIDRLRPETPSAGFASPAEAAGAVGIWDGATLTHAAERVRRVRVVGNGAAWQVEDGRLTALLVEHSSDDVEGARDVWGVHRIDPTAADPRGMPVRPAAGPADVLVLPEPAAYDGAPAYSVLSDSLRQLAGVEMVSTVSRLAHAWSLQNFRLLFGELPLDRPTMVRHRDVRARLTELAPFFEQGSEVVPLVADDSLYWVVELYAGSATYPLSRRFVLLGSEHAYLQHAATALVHAGSGRVRLLPVPIPDALAASWIARFPALFSAPGRLSAAVLAALPPVRDGARAQALAFATSGFRGDSLEVRHFPAPDGADSAASREPLHALLPGLGVSALYPLLDARERVRGAVVAVGGTSRGTSWIPMESDEQRWGTVVDRLRSTDSTGRDRAMVHGPVRVLPVSGRPHYLQTAFQWLPGDSPALRRVSTFVPGSLRSGPTYAAALGTVGTGSPAEPVPRPTAASLHAAMRAALARGDWAAFGRAFDSLGVVLRGTVP